jgi:hypothetical protein
MYLKTTAVSLTAALAMLATPALAAPRAPKAHGKTTAPGQICKSQSHKKTNHGKGKSPFAACVAGVKLARTEAATTPSAKTAPGQLCKDMSRKKSAADDESPFAACVTGAAKVEHGS